MSGHNFNTQVPRHNGALPFGAATPANGGAAPAVINPNLLTWTEELDNGAWTKASAIVVANVGNSPLGTATAEQVINTTGSANISQVSGVTAATGISSTSVTVGPGWARYSVTTTFDSGTYTFSIWLQDPTDSGSGLIVRLSVSGGFATPQVRDGGDKLTYRAWGAKLEVGSTPTGDETTYGMRTT